MRRIFMLILVLWWCVSQCCEGVEGPGGMLVQRIMKMTAIQNINI